MVKSKNSGDVLFAIERSNPDDWTIVYRVNRNHRGHIDQDDPIHIHWLDTRTKERVELTWKDRLGYGIEVKDVEKRKCWFVIKRCSAIVIRVQSLDTAESAAFCKIGNQNCRLDRVYLKVRNKLSLTNPIDHIDFFGTNESGAHFEERVHPPSIFG